MQFIHHTASPLVHHAGKRWGAPVCGFDGQKYAEGLPAARTEAGCVFAQTRRWLAIFRRAKIGFHRQLALHGSPFRLAVWELLQQSVRTCRDLWELAARLAGSGERAAVPRRAVGARWGTTSVGDRTVPPRREAGGNLTGCRRYREKLHCCSWKAWTWGCLSPARGSALWCTTGTAKNGSDESSLLSMYFEGVWVGRCSRSAKWYGRPAENAQAGAVQRQRNDRADAQRTRHAKPATMQHASHNIRAAQLGEIFISTMTGRRSFGHAPAPGNGRIYRCRCQHNISPAQPAPASAPSTGARDDAAERCRRKVHDRAGARTW